MLEDRCVMGVDIRACASRDPRRQSADQSELALLLSEAAHAVGLDRSEWELFPTGDGELAVLPAGVDLRPVVTELVPALHERLVVRNLGRSPARQVRLRMALHVAALAPGSPGTYAGTALVTVSRLLDSSPVCEALAWADDAMVALIVSPEVYGKVVLPSLVAWGGHAFVPVTVELPDQSFRHTAYLHVPGHDLGPIATAASPPAEGTGNRGGSGGHLPRPRGATRVNGSSSDEAPLWALATPHLWDFWDLDL
jgi:hypothetical protein